MSGLLLQKILGAKRTIGIYALIMVIYLFMGMLNGNMAFFGGFCVLLASYLPLNILQAEERSHWNSFANTTSVTRKQIVGSQYVFMGVVITAATLLSLLLSLLNLKGLDGDVLSAIELNLGILEMGFLVQLVAIPLIYKFESSVAMILVVAFAFVPFGITGLLIKFDVGLPSQKFVENLILLFGPVLILILFILSYIISLRIYQKKDF